MARFANGSSRAPGAVCTLLLLALGPVGCSDGRESADDGLAGGAAGHAGSIATAGAGGTRAGGAGGEPSASGSSSKAGGAGAGGRPDGNPGGAGGQGGAELACQVELQCGDEIDEDVKRPCGVRITDARGNAVYSESAGVELRGRSSIQYPKKNYSVELRTATGDENPTNLFGMGQESDWILDGSWVDRSFLRNDLVFHLFRATGDYAPESIYCTLQLNGDERGIYRLVERIKRDDDRLALAEDDGSGKSFLIKQDSSGTLALEIGRLESDWQLVYPNDSTATTAQIAGIQTWLGELEVALQGAEAGAPGALFSLLDVDATVDWILVEEFSKNVDAYNLSLHLARDAGGRARFLPWDLDLSFGQPTVNGGDNREPEGWVRNRTALIRAITNSPELRQKLGPRWRELRAGPFSDAAIAGTLDALAAALTPAALERNFQIWPIEDVDFSDIYEPYTLYPVSSHAEEVGLLRAWIRARLAFMDRKIDTYPN